MGSKIQEAMLRISTDMAGPISKSQTGGNKHRGRWRGDLHTHRFMGLRTALHTKSTYTICTVPGSGLHVRGSDLFV